VCQVAFTEGLLINEVFELTDKLLAMHHHSPVGLRSPKECFHAHALLFYNR
jgi:hypothetical protein